MARGINRLPASYKSLPVGLHCDGGNLSLQVTLGSADNRRLSWIFRYALKGQKTRDMGLGSVNDVSLKDARETARQYRLLVKQGIDPINHRNAEVAKNLSAHRAVMTFDDAATAYIRQHGKGWKNAKHAEQWASTLKAYASPVLGRMSVADIDTPHVMKAIEPIWSEKPETASRLRGRIEAVLGWATVSGHRQGDNPARWKGHLANLLPSRSKVAAVKHQASLPYAEMPDFMSDLRARSGMGALALEFAVLTCVRTADVRNAQSDDVNYATKTWTIPAFSKTGAEHRVPLSTAAITVLQKAAAAVAAIGGQVAASGLAFPNDVSGAKLSENAMLAVLERMGRKGVMTTHGCRSTFRTWAQEQTNFPWELSEMSLGHKVGSKVERAYARGDALKKRFAIMQAWSDFVGKSRSPGKGVVVSLHDRVPA